MPIKFLKMLKKRRAFTLTETIVMITIILILTGIIIVATESSRALARDKKRIAHFAAYQQALARYYNKNKEFPNPKPDLGNPLKDTEEEACNLADCKYLSDRKICICRAEIYLVELKNSGLIDEMMADPKNNSDYWYAYNVDDAGQNYKLVVLLERDIASMKNDGGDCPLGDNTDKCPLKDPNDPSKGRYTALYEVYSTLGAHLAFGYWAITGKSVLACDIIASTTCPGDKPLQVLRLSAQTNAHAALVSSGSYSNTLCCSGPPDLSAQEVNCISGICSNILTLSANTNAHVGNNYTNSYVSFKRTGGSVSCIIEESSDDKCPSSDRECVVSISGDNNAHIGNCSAYTKKVCCKAPSNF